MRTILFFLLICLAGLFFPGGSAAIELVSVDSDENQLPTQTDESSISGDGRYVAFRAGHDIAPEDTNGTGDVYLRDRLLGTTTLVSVNTSGDAAGAYFPRISSDGTAVCFVSSANDLTVGGANGNQQCYVRNLIAGTTTRVSVNASGAAADERAHNPSISGDGSRVVFESRATNLVPDDLGSDDDIFAVTVGDPSLIQRVSEGLSGQEPDDDSREPAISTDGRFVAFLSFASNLVAGGTGTNGFLYRHDLDTGSTILASKNLSGGEPNNEIEVASISADGRYLCYESEASDIVTDDQNDTRDMFVYDAVTDITTSVSRNSAGVQADSVSVGTSGISGDGNHVIFSSNDDNLSPETATNFNIYRHDRTTGETVLISKNLSGEGANGSCFGQSISTDGRHIAFFSVATDLIASDSNGVGDIFVVSELTRSVATAHNAASKAALLKKIKKLKKKFKAAKRKKQVAKVKRFKKKITKLTKQLRSL